MHVDATSVPPSLILAIVATLGCVALLSCFLRVWGGGGGRQDYRGAEVWVGGGAAVCVLVNLVVAVVVFAGRQAHSNTAQDEQREATLLWVASLVQILGLGLVKSAVTLTVLKLATRSWHRSTLVTYLCFTTLLTIFWFGSTLLLEGPITVSWRAQGELLTTSRLLVLINSVLDVTAAVLVALLPLPLLWTSHPTTRLTILLLLVYILATAVIACGSARTYFVHNAWQTSHASATRIYMLCTSIELSLSLLCLSLLTLPSHLFFSRRSIIHTHAPNNKAPSTSTTPTSSPSHTYPSNTYTSTDTVIRHPQRVSYSQQASSPLQFHDNESNLTFDMAPTPSRSRAHTIRSSSPPGHSRNVSDWSQFSGFTDEREGGRAASLAEMEGRTRAIIRDGERQTDGAIGVAVSTMGKREERGGHEYGGEEMEELRRLFADRGVEWGVDPIAAHGISK